MTPRLIVLTLISIVDYAKSRRDGRCVHLQPNELWIINTLPDHSQFASTAPGKLFKANYYSTIVYNSLVSAWDQRFWRRPTGWNINLI